MVGEEVLFYITWLASTRSSNRLVLALNKCRLSTYYNEILIIGFSFKPDLNLDLLLQHRSSVLPSLSFLSL